MIFTFLWRHVELWTAEKSLKPRYFIRDSLNCLPIFARWQPSIGYPILGPMPPLVLFMIPMPEPGSFLQRVGEHRVKNLFMHLLHVFGNICPNISNHSSLDIEQYIKKRFSHLLSKFNSFKTFVLAAKGPGK